MTDHILTGHSNYQVGPSRTKSDQVGPNRTKSDIHITKSDLSKILSWYFFLILAYADQVHTTIRRHNSINLITGHCKSREQSKPLSCWRDV